MRPRFDLNCRPLKERGRREDRVRAAPAVSCAMCTKRCAHEHTGSAESIRPSLRNGFTAYGALSPATNSSCHRRWRMSGFAKTRLGSKTSANLTPATGARTTRFCRTMTAEGVPIHFQTAKGNSETRSRSRRDAPELCRNRSPRKKEGAGNAGCPMRPQPLCKGW